MIKSKQALTYIKYVGDGQIGARLRSCGQKIWFKKDDIHLAESKKAQSLVTRYNFFALITAEGMTEKEISRAQSVFEGTEKQSILEDSPKKRNKNKKEEPEVKEDNQSSSDNEDIKI